eukprot:COSAG06_NODE_65694_length_256_cov_0.719745_2_plen_33_part_01
MRRILRSIPLQSRSAALQLNRVGGRLGVRLRVL